MSRYRVHYIYYSQGQASLGFDAGFDSTPYDGTLTWTFEKVITGVVTPAEWPLFGGPTVFCFLRC
jgi:hypothetical protein